MGKRERERERERQRQRERETERERNPPSNIGRVLAIVPLAMALSIIEDDTAGDEVDYLTRGQELGTVAGCLALAAETIAGWWRKKKSNSNNY